MRRNPSNRRGRKAALFASIDLHSSNSPNPPALRRCDRHMPSDADKDKDKDKDEKRSLVIRIPLKKRPRPGDAASSKGEDSGVRRLPPSLLASPGGSGSGSGRGGKEEVGRESARLGNGSKEDGGGGVGDRNAAEEKVESGSDFPSSVFDVVEIFRRGLVGEEKEDDLQKVASEKGIVFGTPRWWRPGGYGDEK